MRAIIRLKYGLFRLLGVVSPLVTYPLPPRWALSKKGKHRFYDAPDCTGPCCASQYGCVSACCEPVNSPTNLDPTEAAYGPQEGTEAC